ncbi:hypothetical protein [Nostoc sp.]|uniref:hypothetical protein n=1 Tax=Nostoc sp. TaxID=1180 RepID=UPI002FF48675
MAVFDPGAISKLRDLQIALKNCGKSSNNNKMPGVQFRAYSAAQLILPSGEFAPVPQEKR